MFDRRTVGVLVTVIDTIYIFLVICYYFFERSMLNPVKHTENATYLILRILWRYCKQAVRKWALKIFFYIMITDKLVE